MSKKRLPIVAIDHADPVELELGDGSRVRISNAVPGSRSECPTTRPCPHVRCEFHLAFVAGEDRPGRRHRNHEAGDIYPPTLELEVLRGKRTSCTLDVLEAHPHGMSCSEIGTLTGKSARAIEIVVKRAIEKLRSQGVDVSGFEEA